MLDFNTAPYNDDYNEDKKFYKILFRPGYPVQARELTQIQSIIQKQVERHGNHIFKNGSMVIPGQASIDTNAGYIKLETTYNSVSVDSFIDTFVGEIITAPSGVSALVVAATKTVYSSTNAVVEYPTLFVKYQNAETGTNYSGGLVKTFASSNVLTASNTALAYRNVQAISADAVGTGSVVSIARGVYYVNSYFVLVEEQTIVLSKYSATPSARVGLRVVESVVTSTEDESLLDNAMGSYNYSAPGADRYSIELQLTYIDLTDAADDTNFIELAQVSEGNILKIVNKTEYSELEKALARKTYDESGNYVVDNFKLETREFRNNFRGTHALNGAYLVGDVVKYGNNYYVCTKSGISAVNPYYTPYTSPYNWTHDNGIGTDGIAVWQYIENPIFNRGVYTPESQGIQYNDLASNVAMANKMVLAMSPGKAVVRGYEIEKVSTEYLVVDKARTSELATQSYIPNTIGSFYFITNLVGLPPTDNAGQIAIYDDFVKSDRSGINTGANQIGTVIVSSIELYQSNADPTKNIYMMFVIQSNSTDATKPLANFAKAFAYSTTFRADIAIDMYKVGPRQGKITTSSSSTSVTGVDTDFTALSAGDQIIYDNPSGGYYKAKIASITNKGALVLTANAPTTSTSISYYITRAVVQEPAGTRRVYPISSYPVKEFRNASGQNTISYTMTKVDRGLTVTSGQVSITGVTGSVFTSSDDTDNYVVINDSTGAPINSGLTFSGIGTNAITISGLTGISTVSVQSTLSVYGQREKTKIRSLTILNVSATDAAKTEISLGVRDIIRIVGVVTTTSRKNVTDSYILDNGQRDAYYDIGKLKLKPSYIAPTEGLRIEFEYFQHGPGDYFTINSYPEDMKYAGVNYNGVNLMNCVDFRYSTLDPLNGATNLTSIKRGGDMSASYSFYVPRKDKVIIDAEGKFAVSAGAPAVVPAIPPEPEYAMSLYDIMYAPYVFSVDASNIKVTSIDNRRYTMRDIRKLENRIQNLEEYTALSLLEQDTKNMSITGADNLDRMKLGFFVDNFSTHDSGNAYSPDYMCSIDTKNGILRPYATSSYIPLIDTKSSNTDRIANGYQMYGDVITLPVVEEKVLVKQAYASRVQNVNPFAVFTFLGNVKLTPSSDEWFDVDRLPDIVNNIIGNYDAIASIAQRAGVLGTVWNSWQTTWTGAPQEVSRTSTNSTTSSTSRSIREEVVEFGDGWGIRNRAFDTTTSVTTTTTLITNATQIGQTRSGIQTSLIEKLDRQVVNDQVVSTAVIPFMRSRYVLVKVKGLKPKTRFWSYFDRINVTDYCTPASYLSYQLTSGETDFDDESNAGVASNDTPRRIEFTTNSYFKDNPNANSCLANGDVITVTSGSDVYTAVVIGKDYEDATATRRLHIVNIKKNGQPLDYGFNIPSGASIVGSISGATGTTLSTAANRHYTSDSLISTFNGDLNFLYWIPSSSMEREPGSPNSVISRSSFRAGTVEFKLIDADSYSGLSSSSARTSYSAVGAIQKRQASVNSVRNAEIIQTNVNENRVIVQTSTSSTSAISGVTTSTTEVVPTVDWADPLAQTFLVNQVGGAFLSKIDIYFASKDSAIPVTLEIREVVNGYPGKRVLPFSKVTLKPEQVNLSTSYVELPDGLTVRSYDTATSFKFNSPVYVENGQEYAIVLTSDSNKYEVWVSQVGDDVPGTTQTISEQPYAGVLFKSQNTSTWTAEQSQDLKFTIHRCVFDTNNTSYIEFKNAPLGDKLLDLDPFQLTNGTKKIRVWHKDHGMWNGAYVTFKNNVAYEYANSAAFPAIGTTNLLYLALDTNVFYRWSGSAYVAVTSGDSSYVGNVNPTYIYSTFQVSDVDLDCYTITLASGAQTPNVTGYFGQRFVRSTYNINYDIVQPNMQIQTFSDTTFFAQLSTMRGTSIDDTSYTPLTISRDLTENVVINDNNEFNTPYPRVVVGSKTYNPTSGLYEAPGHTMSLICKMKTNNDSVSPIIDTQRISATVVSNKINYPTEVNTNVAVIDDRIVVNAVSISTYYTISGNTITTTNATEAAKLLTLTVGKTVIITNGTTSYQTVVTSVRSLSASSAEVKVSTSISLTGNLTITQREMFADETTPVGSSSFNKYISKVINLLVPEIAKESGDTMQLRVRFSANIPTLANVGVYYRIDTVASTLDNNIEKSTWVEMKTENNLPLPKADLANNAFYDCQFISTELPLFDKMQIKLVMNSTNSQYVPQIKDLRIIAVV